MRLIRLLSLLALLLLAAAPLSAQDPTPAQVDQIQKIVRDYLRDHPEVIISALKQYQDKQAAEQAAKARESIASYKDELFKDPTSPVGANPDGDVVLVEFF